MGKHQGKAQRDITGPQTHNGNLHGRCYLKQPNSKRLKFSQVMAILKTGQGKLGQSGKQELDPLRRDIPFSWGCPPPHLSSSRGCSPQGEKSNPKDPGAYTSKTNERQGVLKGARSLEPIKSDRSPPMSVPTSGVPSSISWEQSLLTTCLSFAIPPPAPRHSLLLFLYQSVTDDINFSQQPSGSLNCASPAMPPHRLPPLPTRASHNLCYFYS